MSAQGQHIRVLVKGLSGVIIDGQKYPRVGLAAGPAKWPTEAIFADLSAQAQVQAQARLDQQKSQFNTTIAHSHNNQLINF